MGRPRGTFGPCRLALLAAAREGPATVADLALRAQVGRLVAHVSVTRMLDAGELVLVTEPRRRPMVVTLPTGDGGAELAQVLRGWV